MRKPFSAINLICKAINKVAIGTIVHANNFRAEYGTHFATSERISWILIGLMHCGILERVKRGHYRVLAYVPDFLDQTTFEANAGFTKRIETPEGTKYVLRGKPWKLGDAMPIKSDPNPIVARFKVNEPAPNSRALERLSGLLTIRNKFEDSYAGGIKLVWDIENFSEMKLVVLKVPYTAHNPKWFTSLDSAINALSIFRGIDVEEVVDILLELNDASEEVIHGSHDHIPSGKDTGKRPEPTISENEISDLAKQFIDAFTPIPQKQEDPFFDGRNDHLKHTEWYKEQVRLRHNAKVIGNQASKFQELLSVPNYIGKTIYFESGNELVKDKIESYQIQVKAGEASSIHSITTEDGEEFNSLDDVFLSKQALTEHYQKMVDAL